MQTDRKIDIQTDRKKERERGKQIDKEERENK